MPVIYVLRDTSKSAFVPGALDEVIPLSEEEVTVKKNLLDILPPDDSNHPFFKGGNAYVFHLKLSLDLVNFSVTTGVGNWIGDVVNDEITI